ncbi:pyridoxamine 5'-phosphate oxidase family protein [Niallia sp.]|uniref:pyridoxamine 5'-phosphate oxidase family protein n=1 Tax=Niallia sp. TaxID=2837523 RepID=UPI00289B40B3|nr:pyridoxamine 5'-phosphate oxidase family protein [Niallia sp.]
MNEMRQLTREVTDKEKINEFLHNTNIGHLGLVDEHLPYVIPLNYVWFHDCLYFHGASEGRKTTIIRKNNHACFTVSEASGVMSNPIPAKVDTAYISVIIFGKVELLEDLNESRDVMQAKLNKYVPGYYEKPLAKSHLEKYTPTLGSKTAIYKISPSSITAKENILNETVKFTPGRTINMDL